ncbi:MAG: SMC-Scp complex subunit ScpB [Erysipelotrichaceae bacterium]|nr:SMC-Scp complex subunit ScpB [Erysipelotrichaceae bacterium]
MNEEKNYEIDPKEETEEEVSSEVSEENVIEDQTAEENSEETDPEALQEDAEEVQEPEEDIFSYAENVKQPDNPEAIVEGLLYIVGEDGARLEQLALAIGKSLEDTRIILENIQEKYASELFGIELVCYGSVYKFISKKAVYPYAQELFGASKQNTLSQAALETLAIIAYKQPITRVEIEELRGVSADVMLRKLQARNLIREAGRSEAVGRPILYEVTEEFMDSFKLYTLNELPDLPEYNKEEDSDNLFE